MSSDPRILDTMDLATAWCLNELRPHLREEYEQAWLDLQQFNSPVKWWSLPLNFIHRPTDSLQKLVEDAFKETFSFFQDCFNPPAEDFASYRLRWMDRFAGGIYSRPRLDLYLEHMMEEVTEGEYCDGERDNSLPLLDFHSFDTELQVIHALATLYGADWCQPSRGVGCFRVAGRFFLVYRGFHEFADVHDGIIRY